MRIVDPSNKNAKEIEAWIDTKSNQWSEFGLACSPDSDFPGAGWYRASRMPLRKGNLCFFQSLRFTNDILL